ncbi:hypothetical protein [Yoonia litorea]|uniref:Lipoprotein n=1 Tax=Yoonia litorea TaxID=1123755 RepID=A0A1I6N349_9RHOB|nr:hypothetical protein [Yoonia litorea]SFS22324.1 hypothetical protein SAMN05444714_3242 [Yoonia litorea]
MSYSLNRRQVLIGLPLTLSACTASQVWAPDDVVARAIYRDPGPKHLTLYTMKNVGSDNGAHSALLINASQRVIFDPAGAWEQRQMPERNDVLFGASPQLEQYYVSFHARVTYYVVGQTVAVTDDVAERALTLALQAGPAPQANCSRFTSRLLRQLPGFGAIRQTWFPNKLSDDFGTLPGASYREYREDDADDKNVAARQIAAALEAGN